MSGFVARDILMTLPPKLSVVAGSWVQAPELLRLPQTILSPTPEDKGKACKLRVAKEDVIKAAENRRRQVAYQFWSVLAGKAPPVPVQYEGDKDSGLTTLMDAKACFKGLKRPNGDDDHSAECVAYVLKPAYFYEYEFRPPLVLSVKQAVNLDVVFVAYAKLDVPSAGAIRGVLTHWEFVFAAEDNLLLPENWQNRYQERLW